MNSFFLKEMKKHMLRASHFALIKLGDDGSIVFFFEEMQ